jgi:acetyl esterase/lipase
VHHSAEDVRERRCYDGLPLFRRLTLRFRCLLSGLFLCVALHAAVAQSVPTAIKLWPAGAPGSPASATQESLRMENGEHILSNIQEPAILPYLPKAGEATGAAIIVAPGGGHRELWMDHEGYSVGEFLSSHGVAAFVLKYRLARQSGSTYTVEGTELQDMQRAIRLVRSRSKEFGIDPERVGVMGFSAGGELAELASTRYDEGSAGVADAIDRLPSKPNFQGLIYPAIPKDPRVTAETPRAFLACGASDRADIAQGLAEYYLSLSRAHVSAELHIYAGIGHGFGIRKTNPEPVASWPSLFLAWMNAQGLLKH